MFVNTLSIKPAKPISAAILTALSISQTALDADIALWCNNLSNIETKLTSQIHNEIRSHIYTAIDIFKDFSTQYWDFFQRTQPPPKTPVGWFTGCAEQSIFEYWEPVRRAVVDYCNYPDLVCSAYLELQNYIKSAPKNIQLVLSNKGTPSLIYFGKVPNAVRIPFGPILLVGIPLVDAHQKEWRSIPHELGHHVYWNASFTHDQQQLATIQSWPLPTSSGSTSSLQSVSAFETNISQLYDNVITGLKVRPSKQKELKEIFFAWREELFAEVVGAQIGGKDYVRASWDKVLRGLNKVEDLTYDDHKHPYPYLIPYIRVWASDITITQPLHAAFEARLPGQTIPIPNTMTQLAAEAIVIQLKNHILGTSYQPSAFPRKDFLVQLIDYLSKNQPGKSVWENLLCVRILTAGLSWSCSSCGTGNNIDISLCGKCKGPRPFWATVGSYIVD